MGHTASPTARRSFGKRRERFPIRLRPRRRPAAFRLSRRHVAQCRRGVDRHPAAVGDLSRVAVSPGHRAGRRVVAERATGGVRGHPAARGGAQHRAVRTARGLQVHPWADRDPDALRPEHRHDLRAAARARRDRGGAAGSAAGGDRHRGPHHAVRVPDPVVQRRGRRSGPALRHRTLRDQADHLARAECRPGRGAGLRRAGSRGRGRSGPAGAARSELRRRSGPRSARRSP